jgi:uncharacterized membrane protein YfcA
LELVNFPTELLTLLFLVAVLAGFLDTLAGGGGLISLPALILSGVPPLAALGTNKLQGAMGTATASYMMIKSKRIQWSKVKYLMVTAFIGAITGAIAVQFVNTDVLSFVIPIVLLCIAIYFLIPRTLTNSEQKPKLSNKKYKNIVIPVIGFYDGMFGPGTGSFFAASGVSCCGQNLITSTAVAKPLNFATNIASLLIFLLAGQIIWIVGLVMMIGQVIGAWLGSHCLFKINPRYLRGLVVLMCSCMLIKYADSMGWFRLIL